ncbi:hypothetical protein BDV18DRAFT_152496 [Aspergillus unguis]
MIDLKPHKMHGITPVTPTIFCPIVKERIWKPNFCFRHLLLPGTSFATYLRPYHRKSLILYTDSLTLSMQLISAFISLSGPGRTIIQLGRAQVNHYRLWHTQGQSVHWIQNGLLGIYLVIFDIILLEPLGLGFILLVEICTLVY